MSDTYFEQEPFATNWATIAAGNPSQRCPCLLLLDVSASMSGQPLEELNRGLVLFKDELAADLKASKSVQIGVVTFGPVQTVTDFVDAEYWQAPTLTAQGNTPMGEAIEQGLAMLETHKSAMRNNGLNLYRPWVFLITDGGPTDSWQNAARLVHEGEAGKKFVFFAVGVQNANFDVLKQISVSEPLALQGLQFRKLFQWLSDSMKRVSQSKPGEEVPLQNPAAPNGWGKIV
jgi:uncharacterized protein YegL